MVQNYKGDMKMPECRFCGNLKLDEILDLGIQPLANSFIDDKYDEEYRYPLRLVTCDICGLVQLDYIVDPKLIFNKDYVYHTGNAKPVIDHAQFLEKNYTEFVGKHKFVIEIGSNDGTILKQFRQHHSILGIEPCSYIAYEACRNKVPTISKFFTVETAKTVHNTYGTADLILLRNVFAHIPYIHDTMKALQILLKEDGIIEIEAPWLVNIIKNIEFDTIYHEHYSYLSLRALTYLMRLYGFEIFDVKELNIHGGALLYYICKAGKYIINKENIQKIEKEESQINTLAYERFRQKTQEIGAELSILLNTLASDNKIVVCLGAPAKGNTLLNYCKIDTRRIDYCTDTTEAKQGKYTPGSHIYVYSEDMLSKARIDYLLVTAWNFLDYIVTKPEVIRLRQNGTKLIVPIPEVKII
jgi:hypothetical protein